MPSEGLILVAARDLQPGDIIYLTDTRHGTISLIEFDKTQFIVGGPLNGTATALRLKMADGESFLVHPGQIFGLIDQRRHIQRRIKYIFT